MQYSICHTPPTQFEAGGSRGPHSLHPWPASDEDPAYCPACDPDPDSDSCVPESSFLLLLRPVWDFLVLPGSCSCNTQLWETQYWFCIFCFISLIINIFGIISVISKAFFYIPFVSLSLFLLFPFL